ncbi:MAG: DNA cytosine methyltransferase [Holophaga sp.]|nr:DNA cytosine methyltransferase [Holophaga sp.]
MPRALELFSGLGGWSYALGARGTVLAAYDISPAANATYLLNHGRAPLAREIARVKPAEFQALGADTWLLSPPCQPFCRMGRGHGLADPRSQAFLHLLDVLREAPPERLALENVVGFLGSPAHQLLEARLEELGFHHLSYQLCPSSFGMPNLRPRAFLLAARHPLEARPVPVVAPAGLAGFLDPEEDPALYLEPGLRHGPGLDLATPESRRTACFIGGYGQRFVGSGSFLQTPRGIRRFSPAEIARLMGLPEDFRFPPETRLEQRYRLLGNGLSLPVARWVLDQLL